MNKKLLGSLISLSVLWSLQAVGAIGNIVQITPNAAGQSIQSYDATACCNAQGDAAYCSKYTMLVNAFDVSVAASCSLAGIKLSSGYFPTNCAVQPNGFCTFSAFPNHAPRTITAYQNVVVRSITPLLTQNLLFGTQVVATGWPNQSPPNNWGFDGSGSVNFNVQGNHIQADLVVAQPYNGCSALTNAAAIAGKIALVQRGTCEFGLKGINAQTAGATGVVLVNNAPGVIFMGAGAFGSSVVIPMASITPEDGQGLLNTLGQGSNVSIVMGNIS